MLEIGNHSIKVEFGHIKNLWKDMPQNFWDNPNDTRHTKLNYLENLSIKLEINSLIKFCKKYNHKFLPDVNNLKPVDFIINKLSQNTHIHGKVTCLDDIKKSITKDSYDYLKNSNDKNGKKIICGDRKCFYDKKTKRLSIGVAWHNINNMWWIIVNDKLYNISSFDLFDYNPALPRRMKGNSRVLKLLLQDLVSRNQYLKANHVYREIQRHEKFNA